MADSFTPTTGTGECPKCKATNARKLWNCMDCGARLPWADEDIVIPVNPIKKYAELEESLRAKPAKPNPVATGSAFNFCPQCGTKRVGSGVFCPECGQRFGAPVGELSDEVRPLPGTSFRHDSVSNNIVWIIAFAPILSAFIQGAIAGSWEVSLMSLWWIAPAINSLLCLMDKSHLDSVGENTDGLAGWAIFFVTGYLFVRADRLNQSPGYAWVWLVMFAITIMPVLVVPL